MDWQLYQKYLKEYTIEALEESGNDVSLAADYLNKKTIIKVMFKGSREKKAALERVKKIFNSNRERSLYVVLKSLGFDDNYVFKCGDREVLYKASGFGQKDIIDVIAKSYV